MPNTNTTVNVHKGKKGPDKPEELKDSKLTKNWDHVDEQSYDSFPASDPPSSYGGRDIAPPVEDSTEEEESSN